MKIDQKTIEENLREAYPGPEEKSYFEYNWGTQENGRLTLKNFDPKVDQYTGGARSKCPCCGETEFQFHPDCLLADPVDPLCFYVPFHKIFQEGDKRIFVSVMSPYNELHLRWLPFLRKNDVVLFADFGSPHLRNVEFWKKVRAQCSFPENLYFMCNSRVAVASRVEAGLNALLIPHNAWLDEHQYRVCLLYTSPSPRDRG